MKEIVFTRHAKIKGKTYDEKKGPRFIGQNLNFSTSKPNKEKISKLKKGFQDFDLFFSSPLKRCIQTLKLLTKKEIIIDKNILEINYGEVEGMFLEEAKEKFPEIFEYWTNGVDAKFPKGENNLDVITRVKKFLRNLEKFHEKRIFVCTHNVVLRCLIGSSLKIPVKDWYKINIPYFEPIPFILEDKKLIYVGDEEQKNEIFKNLMDKKMKSYFVALIPDNKTRAEVLESKLKIFEIFGNQKYLSDPPHLTLYVSLAENLKKVEKHLKKISKAENKINAGVQNEFQEFPGDKLAGGGTSLGLKFNEESNYKVQMFQKKIVDGLNGLRKGEIHKRYRNVDLPKPLMESVQKYGFPFVSGNDDKPILIPHISFCCFNPPENAEQFKQIYPIEKFSGKMKFDKVSLYKLYEDDKTELIREFELQ